jgi:hypothetical protein
VYTSERIRTNSNLNIRNIILVNKNLLLKSKKFIKNDFELNVFPDELYKYIRKPSPEFLSKMLLAYSCRDKTDEINDIYRCISISSILYRKEIPLVFVKLDNRTKRLFHLICDDLSLKHILVMNFYLEKIKDIIKNNKEEYNGLVNRYVKDLDIVGEGILKANEEFSFPSLVCFTEKINKKYQRNFTEAEVQSLCSAFSAVTAIKIPKMYIKIDIVTLSLIHFKNSKEFKVHD